MLSVCLCVVVILCYPTGPPSKTPISNIRPGTPAPVSLLGQPNAVHESKAVDPWSHTSALPPTRKPKFHIIKSPPSVKPESRITTPPITKSKMYPTTVLLPESSSQAVSTPQIPMTESRSKVLLIWTKLFGESIWDELLEGMLPCAQYNINVSCRITYNKNEYEHSELVAFHGRGNDFAVSNLPDLSKRSPHQRWVYCNRESPMNYGLLSIPSQGKRLNGLFNWTMTYRVDSDIDLRYALIVPGETSDEYNTQKSRGGTAVAVIRNCLQQRMNYIHELQKHMQVHVYGECGTYNCPSGDACFDMLKGKYKFYLSFENSVCKDYVTEKFYFNALQHNMLPVVINGGNFSDPTVAPPGCCIKASNFKGARELAEYIKMVARNSTLYNNYFKWHSRYTVQEEPRTKVFCRACHKLYTDSETKVYHNLYSWFGTEENCVPYPSP